MNVEIGEGNVESIIPITAKLSPEDAAPRDEQISSAYNQVLTVPDQVKSKYDVWIEEYRSLRAEIIAIGTSARQGTQVAIVALAAVISLAGYIVQNDLPILFLLAPFIFYALAWTQLRLAYTARTISDYIVTTIAEETTRTITQTDFQDGLHVTSSVSNDNRTIWKPLGWETTSRSEMHSHRRRLRPIEASSV